MSHPHPWPVTIKTYSNTFKAHYFLTAAVVQSGVGSVLGYSISSSMRFAGMTAILSFALLLLLILASLETVEGADTPPASGTWTIDVGETVTHSGATIDLRGDLHVWGTLELDNSTLWVWLDASSPRELVIHPGGKLLLTNTAVASQDLGRAYVLQAEDGSVLHLDRSSFWRAGDRLTKDGRYSGVHVATDDAMIRDTVFMECLVGLWVTSADVQLADCDFVDCRYGAVVDTSGYLIIDRAYILRCTIGALSNASMMTVRDGFPGPSRSSVPVPLSAAGWESGSCSVASTRAATTAARAWRVHTSSNQFNRSKSGSRWNVAIAGLNERTWI